MYFSIALVAVSSALAVVYFWKIVEQMWFSEIKFTSEKEDAYIYLPIWTITISIIIFGVYSSPIIDFSNFCILLFLVKSSFIFMLFKLNVRSL